jgi:hypothetical protein
MAYDFNGTDQRLNTTSTPVSAVPLTLACWFRADDVTSNRCLFELATSFGVNGFRLLVAGAIAGDPIFADYTVDGTGANAQTTAGYTVNTFHHAAATFPNNTTVTAYLDGGNSATSTGSAVNPAPTRINIGARFLSSPGLFFDGRIAEVGIWNAALTAAEIASLAKGMTCDKVRPQSLVFYAPLIRNLQDVRGGLTITNNNTATVANHTRVYA